MSQVFKRWIKYIWTSHIISLFKVRNTVNSPLKRVWNVCNMYVTCFDVYMQAKYSFPSDKTKYLSHGDPATAQFSKILWRTKNKAFPRAKNSVFYADFPVGSKFQFSQWKLRYEWKLRYLTVALGWTSQFFPIHEKDEKLGFLNVGQ